MNFEQINEGHKGFFRAMDNGKEAGRMTFTRAGEKGLVIDHTDVNPDYRGQNIGTQILMELVRYARENEIKVMPLCPFAKSVFDKKKEIRDVLY